MPVEGGLVSWSGTSRKWDRPMPLGAANEGLRRYEPASRLQDLGL